MLARAQRMCTEDTEEATRQLGSMDFTFEAQQIPRPQRCAAQHVSPTEMHGMQVHYSEPHPNQSQTELQAHILLTAAGSAATDDTLSPHHELTQSPDDGPMQPSQSPASSDASSLGIGTNSRSLEKRGGFGHAGLAEPCAAAGESSQGAGEPAQHAGEPAQHAGEPAHDAAPMDIDCKDPAGQRYRKAKAAVAHLKLEAGAANQLPALQTLLKLQVGCHAPVTACACWHVSASPEHPHKC